MRALVYDGTLRLENSLPVPTPEGDQALIKIRRAGICNTDLELIGGMYGFSGVLGHEFVGEVVGGAADWQGQRVVGEINVACRQCDFCRRGIPSQCRNRVAVGIRGHSGAFADYLALTGVNLHRVPDSVSDAQAAFTEPLAAALEVTEAVHISPRDRVIVVGAGKLGLLVTQVLRLTGADVIAVTRREAQARLVERWGVFPAALQDLESRRAQVVVDCTGNAEGFAAALDLVESRGTIVLKSTYHGLPPVDMTQVAVREIRVVGSRCGPFPAALKLLQIGLVETEPLLEATYPFDDALAAVEHAARPGTLKIALTM